MGSYQWEPQEVISGKVDCLFVFSSPSPRELLIHARLISVFQLAGSQAKLAWMIIFWMTHDAVYEQTQDTSSGLRTCPETLHSSGADGTLQWKGSVRCVGGNASWRHGIDCRGEYPRYPQMPPSLLTIDHSWACSFVLIETSLAGLSVSRGSLKSFLLPAYSLLLSWLFLKQKKKLHEGVVEIFAH